VADLATEGRDAFVRFWSSVHEATYRVSGGRALTRVLGMSVVQLTTVGRRSGRLRSTILTAPIVEAERIVLVASNGGDDRNPQWYLNMMAKPTVGVARGGVKREFEGRVAHGSERADLWRTIRTVTPIYELHQRRTSRELPVVVLEASRLPPDPTA
jgi:deazaflavin-dependent oxidoreductase (nitroreductase family)